MKIAASLITVAVLGLAASAQAASVGLNVYQTNMSNGTNLNDISIALTVSETASAFKFHFTNESTVDSSMSKVFFDNSLAAVLAGSPSIASSAGVNFYTPATKQTPGQAANVGWTGTLAFVQSHWSNHVTNGINSNSSESLTLTVAKVAGASITDLLHLLTTTGGIAVHVLNLEGHGQTVFVNLSTFSPLNPTGSEDIIATPTPASAIAGLGLLGMLAARRRRLA